MDEARKLGNELKGWSVVCVLFRLILHSTLPFKAAQVITNEKRGTVKPKQLHYKLMALKKQGNEKI